MLDWVLVLETEYERRSEPYVYEAILLPSSEMCADLAQAKLEDLIEQPCSYTTSTGGNGSGAPVKATAWCYSNPKRQAASWVARGGEGPPAFGVTASQGTAWGVRQKGSRDEKPERRGALCLNGYDWEPCS